MSVRRRARGARGFTLVEVMVSLVISSLLIGMILSLFIRMSTAYRGQQGVAELQQILAAAHGLIEADLRQAGLMMPDGFFMAADQELHQPVELQNDPDGFGPDRLSVFYADPSAQARVTDFNGGADLDVDAFSYLTVDDNGAFAPGDLIAIVKTPSDVAPDNVQFYTCVAQIAGLGGTTNIYLASAGPWGSATNDQCDEVRTAAAIGPVDRAMVYRFRARGYRIDPTRRQLAVLQVSPSGGYVDDWQDLAVGFTDLQVASRWDDSATTGERLVDTVDLDADPVREWYSDITQETKSQAIVSVGAPFRKASYTVPARSRLVALRVSLVVRTHTKIETIPSSRTPLLMDPARPGNNDLGDRDEVQLEGVADGARPLELRGDNVYRYATIGADLRNLGVGL